MNSRVQQRYEFGPFQLDTANHSLLREGQLVPLTPKAFDLLEVLVENNGRLIEKDELLKEIWPDSFVEEGNINRNISIIRKVLGEDATGKPYIETVPKRGYRFVASVRKLAGNGFGVSGNEPCQNPADSNVVLQARELDSGSLRDGELPSLSGKLRRFSATRWAVVAIAATALGTAGWFWFRRSTGESPVNLLAAVPLTAYPGWESSLTFSPDGSQVAFEWSKTSRYEDADIYIKQIGVERNPAQLTDNPAPDQTPAWSPDGRTVAFARILPPDWQRIAYVVTPQRGGSERTIAEFDAPGYVNFEFYKPVNWCAWTPDSKSLVVVGANVPGASVALFWVSLETGEKRRLTDPPADSADFNPAVSPDGGTLAFSRGRFVGRADLCLLTLSEEMKPQGEPKRLSWDIRGNLFPAWTSDGREIVFVSSGGRDFDVTFWRIAVANSAQRQPLSFAAWHSAVSRHGNRLAYSTWKLDTNIWRVEAQTSGRKPGQAMKVFSSTFVDSEPAYSPDGREIAFMSGRSGSWEIWVADSEGSNPEKLTDLEGFSNRPRWSPDGQRIAFHSDASGNRDVCVMRKDGSKLRRLTMDSSSDTNPSWSADGKWIFFHSDRSKQDRVWKVPAEGGEPIPVSGVHGGRPVESPDGKFLYYEKGWAESYSIWRVPTSGGAETQVVDSLHGQGGGWVVMHDGVYFISKPDKKGVSHIRFKDLATGSVRTVAAIEHPVWWGLTVSPDRRSFLYSQADDYGSDLMLVENFR